jgi:hypothetical protein
VFDTSFLWDDKVGTYLDLRLDWWMITKVDNLVTFRVDSVMVTDYDDL